MTGICVTYNTTELFRRAFESVRRHHPGIDIIIIDGSDQNNSCYAYTDSLRNDAMVIHAGSNIGHGRGLHLGLEKCETECAFIFDSDIVMLQSPLSEMCGLIHRDIYGVGWITEIGRDGFDYGTPGRDHRERIKYLHPYFAMINVRQYKQFAPFVHHGAPWFKSMVDLHDRGLSDSMLVQFHGLTGHTSGRGINWIGRPSFYIQHDFGGTRHANVGAGKLEIPGKWDR